MTVTEKTCSKCQRVLPREAFTPSKRYRSGLRSACRDCLAADSRQWRRNYPDRHAASARNSSLKWRYGITQDEYERMAEAQGHTCAICGTDDPGARRRWSVDHCHQTGRVRALLCGACNVGIGHMGHDPERLRAAAIYIEKHEVHA